MRDPGLCMKENQRHRGYLPDGLSLIISWGVSRPNELTELTGETGSGKTTWAVNLAYRLSSQDNHPVLIASFEMKPTPILKKMIQTKAGRPTAELSRKDLIHPSSIFHPSHCSLSMLTERSDKESKGLRFLCQKETWHCLSSLIIFTFF